MACTETLDIHPLVHSIALVHSFPNTTQQTHQDTASQLVHIIATSKQQSDANP